MKKTIQFVTFLLLCLLIGSSANAQFFNPTWVNDIGGTSDSKASNIAADNAGNIYVSGYIKGTIDFNLREGGTKTLTSAGGVNVYVAKYNLATGSYIWAISLPATKGYNQPNSMCVDSQGNVLIAGQFTNAVNFNPQGNFTLTPEGADDIFVAKYTSNGDFIWAISMGGIGIDRAHYITTDNQNNVILSASYTGAIDVDPSASVYDLPDQGSLACFFAKYDSNGNFVWAHPLGAVFSGQDLTAVAVDKTTNDVVVTGDFEGSVDFSYSGQASATFNSSGISNFLARYTNAGVYEWVKYLPGSGTGIMSSLTIDHNSNIIITGNFGGKFYAGGPASTPLSAKGTSDVVLASYKGTGALTWAENFGSSNSNVSCRYVATDVNNNLYITGYFTGTIVIDPALTNGTLTSVVGGQSALIAGFNSAGKAIAAGSLNGSCTSNEGYEIAAVGGGVFVAGAFCQTVNFDTGSCQTDDITSINSVADSYLARFTIVNSSQSQIFAFTLPQQTAIAAIDQTKFTIAITVAPGTNIKALTPVITTTNNGVTSPASGVTEDFTSPVKYTLNSGCSSVTYTVTVTLDKLSGIDTVCAGASNIIKGDDEKFGVPITSYTWQVFKNGVWVTAPGTATNVDYNTSALANNTGAAIIYNLRRQIVLQDGNNDIVDDSFNNVTVEPIVAISGNTVTPPAVSAFCVSGTSAAITGSTPAGGTGVYTYQWQNSTDGVNFTDITGATLKSLTPAAISITTYYRRLVKSGTCVAQSISNAIKLTVAPLITNNTITAPATTDVCATGDPGAITGDAPSGGNGGYIFQWQQSPDNDTFTDIAGANLINFDPGAINATTYYRRVVSSPTCTAPVLSNVVTVTVTPAITDNTVTAPAVTIFCLTGDPGNIIGNVPSGGNGIYTYQWQSSTDNVNFTAIGGANATDYDPPVISATTYYRRLVASGVCTLAVPGNTVAIVIKGPPAAPSLVTSAIMVCPGSITKFSVSSPVAGETYEWYDSPAKTNLLFTGITYVTSPVTADETFYVEAVQGTCVSATLTTATVTVAPLPAAPQLVKSTLSSCNAASETLSILNPQPGFVYNWYTSSSGGAPVFTGIDFVTPALNANTTYYAETVNSMGCISASRTPAVITVNALPVVTAQGTSVCAGSSASLIATSTDQNAVINWYANATGGSILFTGGTFTTPVLTAATNYYAEAVDNTTGCTSLSRVSVPVTITIALAAPAVTVGAVTSSTVTFQWDAVTGATSYEVSLDNGNTFSAPTSGADGLTDIVSGLQPQQSVTLIVLAMGAQSCQLSNPSAAVTGATISPLGDYIYVPNAFTPNSDGKNDIVYVHSENIKSLKFYVYDQWGEMLYTSLSQQNGWDGTYKGTKEPVGVYVYYLEAIMNDGQQINKKGTITLLR